MTLISSSIALVMLPCNLVLSLAYLYNNEAMKFINFGKMFLSLAVILVASVAGLYCSSKMKCTRFSIALNKTGNVFALVHILLALIVVCFDNTLSFDMWSQSWKFYIGLALPCIIGLILSSIITSWFKLLTPERMAVAFECSSQNSCIAIAVAIGMFDAPQVSKALVVPLYMALVNTIVLGLYFLFTWKNGWTKAPSDKNICVVLFKPYEIWENDAHEKNRHNEKRNHGGDIMIENQLTVEESFEDGGSERGFGIGRIEMAFSQDNNASEENEDDRNRKLGLMLSSSPPKPIEVNNEPPAPLSPTSTTMPGSSPFEHNEMSRNNSFKNGKMIRRSSNAAKSLIIEETITEDSIAEDPDMSIAGESDLESGLSVSHHSNISLHHKPTSVGIREDSAPGALLPSIPSNRSFRNSSDGADFPTVNYDAYMNSQRADGDDSDIIATDDQTPPEFHLISDNSDGHVDSNAMKSETPSSDNPIAPPPSAFEPTIDKKPIEDNAQCNETVSVSVGTDGDDNEDSFSNLSKVVSGKQDEEV